MLAHARLRRPIEVPCSSSTTAATAAARPGDHVVRNHTHGGLSRWQMQHGRCLNRRLSPASSEGQLQPTVYSRRQHHGRRRYSCNYQTYRALTECGFPEPPNMRGVGSWVAPGTCWPPGSVPMLGRHQVVGLAGNWRTGSLKRTPGQAQGSGQLLPAYTLYSIEVHPVPRVYCILTRAL
jgi:hypothetical protein